MVSVVWSMAFIYSEARSYCTATLWLTITSWPWVWLYGQVSLLWPLLFSIIDSSSRNWSWLVKALIDACSNAASDQWMPKRCSRAATHGLVTICFSSALNAGVQLHIRPVLISRKLHQGQPGNPVHTGRHNIRPETLFASKPIDCIRVIDDIHRSDKCYRASTIKIFKFLLGTTLTCHGRIHVHCSTHEYQGNSDLPSPRKLHIPNHWQWQEHNEKIREYVQCTENQVGGSEAHTVTWYVVVPVLRWWRTTKKSRP